MKRLSVFATVVVMVVVASGVLLAQSNPFVGTWKLNLAKSKFISGTPPKEGMFTVQRVGDEDQITVNGTAADGSSFSLKYDLPDKGGAGKILAGPFDAVSGKVIDDSTREVSFMKGGKEMTYIRLVSKDGKTASETVKGTDPQGKPVSEVLLWEKQ
jgi:hypothetical protein